MFCVLSLINVMTYGQIVKHDFLFGCLLLQLSLCEMLLKKIAQISSLVITTNAQIHTLTAHSTFATNKASLSLLC